MPNRLGSETSPYLQQHADNPVDWYPWGEEALRAAREQDKPILLSVGYSACHWCHVMAHESFEDPEIAAIMNRHFINVKVDREERPDIDQIYQTAHQLFSQRAGGWPLTMFLAPDQTPFFGGTYFPKGARYGLPGFGDLLERVADLYRTRRDEIEQQNESVRASFARLGRMPAAHHSDFSAAPLDAAVALLASSADREWGGFGAAPKFPHVTDLALLMRRHAATGAAEPRDIAVLTLERMAQGGIYDHLGGGFCRYSTDREWTIPHFEKMLYDNGPLLGLYADAYALTGRDRYAGIVSETAAWLMREMQSPEGGYYSTLDADSEGHEGKFYVWTPDEVRALVTPDEYAVVAPHYGLDGPPNFEGTAWHLREVASLAAVAERLSCPEDECRARLDAARAKLFNARSHRIWPGRDEKILTSWNALAIAGMARAARIFARPEWLDSARCALHFVRTRMWDGERLLATYKDGRAHLNAYLDDHAFLIDALLELVQAGFRADDLAFAEDLADALLERFEDAGGGFLFTSHDHERLLQRPKPGHDNATPSGNGVAAFALNRLGHLTGETRYLRAAERTVAAFYRGIEHSPAGYGSLLSALEELLSPPRVVILRGEPVALRDWQQRLAQAYRPDTLVLAVPRDAGGLPPALDKPASARGVNAYLCEGVTCLAPVDDPGALEGLLKERHTR